MRLLVVEDEARLASHLKRGLAAEGYEADVAHTGTEGLRMALDVDYDLILLDLMLPGMNGSAVCKRLRDAGKWVPILMLTARDGEFDEISALDAGIDDFVTKPFSFIVLLARIRALLRRSTPERPTEIHVGDLTMDAARRRVDRAGTEIGLSPREYALLEYFMRHSGEPLDKAAILGGVWDSEFEGDTNIVEVYVGYLRRKIDAPFGLATIETVRGVGYRMCPGQIGERRAWR